MDFTCCNWLCDRNSVRKPIMCEESLSSLFLFAADNSGSGRQSLQTWSDRVREERRPKPFRRTDKCLPVTGFFAEKTDG